MFKYLRITASALCLMACVLLIVLWVRTKFAYEGFFGPLTGTSGLGMASRHGGVGIIAHWNTKRNSSRWGRFKFAPDESSPREYATALGFGFYQSQSTADDAIAVFVPDWSLLILFGTISAVPWIRWSRRFSLRTLLIGMTLVAVVLGIVVVSR